MKAFFRREWDGNGGMEMGEFEKHQSKKSTLIDLTSHFDMVRLTQMFFFPVHKLLLWIRFSRVSREQNRERKRERERRGAGVGNGLGNRMELTELRVHTNIQRKRCQREDSSPLNSAKASSPDLLQLRLQNPSVFLLALPSQPRPSMAPTFQ